MRPMSEILEENDPMVRIADALEEEENGPIVRIANALEEILRLVKEDQERSRKYMEDAAAIERQAKSE